jgi:hypothetical protein
VKLTVHRQLMPRSRICGAIHALLHTSSWRSAEFFKHRYNFTFYHTFRLRDRNVLHCTVCKHMVTSNVDLRNDWIILPRSLGPTLNNHSESNTCPHTQTANNQLNTTDPRRPLCLCCVPTPNVVCAVLHAPVLFRLCRSHVVVMRQCGVEREMAQFRQTSARLSRVVSQRTAFFTVKMTAPVKVVRMHYAMKPCEGSTL